MGVYIKGMEMPKSCRECPFETYYFNCGETRCRATLKTLATDFQTITFDGRADYCPLIELPPHGRLVDADALKAKQQEDADLFINSNSLTDKIRRDEALNAVANIVNATTVIEAEPPKDGEA